MQRSLIKSWTQCLTVGALPPCSTSPQCLTTLSHCAAASKAELRGPRILTVGEPIWTIEPVYVRDFLRQNHIHIEDTETPEQAIALVRDHAAKGANGIKLFTGSD